MQTPPPPEAHSLPSGDARSPASTGTGQGGPRAPGIQVLGQALKINSKTKVPQTNHKSTGGWTDSQQYPRVIALTELPSTKQQSQRARGQSQPWGGDGETHRHSVHRQKPRLTMAETAREGRRAQHHPGGGRPHPCCPPGGRAHREAGRGEGLKRHSKGGRISSSPSLCQGDDPALFRRQSRWQSTRDPQQGNP